MFFTLIFGDNFFISFIQAKCVRDESCRENLAQTSPKGPNFVEQTDFCEHMPFLKK